MASNYAIAWGSFLRSERLRTISIQAGYRILFSPHANIQPYLSKFALPDYIDVISHDSCSIQEMFCRSSFMVTDYSSVAFDMAYLQKPIIYYQLDKDDFFSGGHLFKSGHFDRSEEGRVGKEWVSTFKIW